MTSSAPVYGFHDPTPKQRVIPPITHFTTATFASISRPPRRQNRPCSSPGLAQPVLIRRAAPAASPAPPPPRRPVHSITPTVPPTSPVHSKSRPDVSSLSSGRRKGPQRRSDVRLGLAFRRQWWGQQRTSFAGFDIRVLLVRRCQCAVAAAAFRVTGTEDARALGFS